MSLATRRPVVQPDYVVGVDGLRGLAALLVVVHHCWVQSGEAPLGGLQMRGFVNAGYFGVDLFFVVSGFVLFLPMVRRGGAGSGRSYALRRAGRMLPAYYVLLTAILLFRRHLRILSSGLHAISWGGLAHLLMLQTPVVGHSPDMGFGVATQIWTLSDEVLFYGVLFFVATGFAKRPLVGLFTTVAIALGWRALIAFGIHDTNVKFDLAMQVPSYAAHFGLGMLVAVIHVRQPPQARARFARAAPWLAGVATIAVVVLVTRTGVRELAGHAAPGDHNLRNLGIAVCFAVVLLCVANGPQGLRQTLSVRPLQWLGEVSYGVYLFHLPLIGLAIWCYGGTAPLHAATNERFFTLLGWVVPATCLVAWASYAFIESPIREGARRLAKRHA